MHENDRKKKQKNKLFSIEFRINFLSNDRAVIYYLQRQNASSLTDKRTKRGTEMAKMRSQRWEYEELHINFKK